MGFKPLHDRVVIERLAAEEKTVSGIVLPGSASEKPDMGLVVSVGDGKVLENGNKVAMNVKVGDKVIFGKYAGQQVKVDGKDYLIMNETDIFGIIA